MSGASAVVIGGGGMRTALVLGTGVPVVAGDAVENTGTVQAYLTFINNAMQLEDIFLDAGKAHAFTEPGAVTLQS